MENDAPLTEQDGAELIRLLTELISLTQQRSLVNDLHLQYHQEPKAGEGWRVGVKGLADEGQQVIGAGAGLLDAMRQGRVALREQQVAETKPRRRSKPTQRRAPG